MRNRKIRTALVTGAAGKLGAAISRELVRRGFFVAVADLDEQAAMELHTSIQRTGGDSCPWRLDVTCPESWRDLRCQLQSRWSRLDMLVNNAGIVAVSEFADLDWREWQRVMDVNLYGTALGCHSMATWLNEGSETSYVMNVASYTGLVPIPWSAAYTVSKAAIIGLTEALRVEWLPHQVSLTAVCPGFFESGMFERSSISDPSLAEVLYKALARSSLTADEVARCGVQGTLQGRPYVVLPSYARWQWRLKRLLPGWFLARLGRDAHAIRARAKQRIAESDCTGRSS